MIQTAGLLCSFAVILGLSSRRFNLGLSLVAGGMVIAVTARMSVADIIRVAYTSALDLSTIRLATSVCAIHLLGYMMKRSGLLDRMVNDLTLIIRDPRVLTAALPMVVGMLTVPGGAIMSAPMVERSGERAGMDKLSMAAANLLFRHFWYFVYPLHPLFILVADLSGLTAGELIRYSIWPTIVGAAVAAAVCFRGSRKALSDEGRPSLKLLAAFAIDCSPILAIILTYYVLRLEFVLAAGAGVATAGYFLRRAFRGQPPVAFIKELAQHIDLKLALTIVGVMVLKGYVMNSGSVELVATTMTSAGFPIIALAVVIPFAAGLLTGTNYPGVGIAFAVFGPVLDTHVLRVAYYALVFVCSIAGYLLSPVHLCYVLTRDYYDVSMGTLLKRVAAPVLSMVGAATLMVLILSALG